MFAFYFCLLLTAAKLNAQLGKNESCHYVRRKTKWVVFVETCNFWLAASKRPPTLDTEVRLGLEEGCMLMWSVKLIWFHALENYNQSLNNYRVITVEYIQCNSYYFNCNCYAWDCATDFKIRDRDLRCVFINFEPKTLSAENFEIMVQIKLKKMTENADGRLS